MTTEVYTIRMGFFDTRPWTGDEVVNLYKSPLSAAGFYTSQLPSVSHPTPTVKVSTNDPFPGSMSISINLPPFSELTQTRDTNVSYAQDPMKLATMGKAAATIFSWNVCREITPGAGGDPSGTLRELFRKILPEPGTLKLSPKIGTWAATPEIVDGYPPKPPRPDCATATAGAGFGSPWLLGLLGLLGLLALGKKEKKR
jgi:hypothetical protein